MQYIEKLPSFSAIEVTTASNLARSIDPGHFITGTAPELYIEGQLFDSTFSPRSMKEQNYTNASFQNVSFAGTNAYSARFKNCIFDQCKISDANFKCSDFSESQLCFDSSASSFDASDFSDAKIHASNLLGCSFSDSFFSHAEVSDTKFTHCEFVGAEFDEVRFSDCDFTLTNLDYAEFSKPRFSNVILPYWGILHVTKGLQDILSCSRLVFATPTGNHQIGVGEYLDEIRFLCPYFYDAKDFVSLVNLYLLDGKQQDAYSALIGGIQDACKHGHFKQLKHLCRMASFNRFFSREQLRALYQLVENQLATLNLSYVEYKNYLLELDSAKRLLIDSPFERDTISITLQTSIENTNYNKLSSTLMLIDKIVAENTPQVTSYVEIRHNSPVEIVIQMAGAMGHLLLAFAFINAAFDKSTTYIERIQNILLNRKELRNKDKDSADIDELKAQIDELKTTVEKLEHANSTQVPSLLYASPEDIRRISYTLSAKKHVFPELLVYTTIPNGKT